MATSQGGGFAERGADLHLDSVTKEFPGFIAVDDLTVTIPAGSFFALLGPSGCGKTTTLRMVAGLEDPTSGRILIGGEDVTLTKAYQRPVNTVFQSYALFPHLSIIENVAFGLRRRKISDALELAKDALDLVELGHVAQRKPAQLSGGQQQRVALARAVVNRPALLLLDEPLGALDLKLRRQMQLELKDIQNEVGLTFLHVTHDQEEAMTMADTVAVMNKGKIEQMGAPEVLYENPATSFVATFLGQSNLWRGEVVGQAGNYLEVAFNGQSVKVLTSRSVVSSGQITVGVRPEKILIHTDAPDPDSSRVVVSNARVIDASFTGSSTQYLLDAGPFGEIAVFSQNFAVGHHAVHGDVVQLSFSIDHVFGVSAHGDIHDADAYPDNTAALSLAEE